MSTGLIRGDPCLRGPVYCGVLPLNQKGLQLPKHGGKPNSTLSIHAQHLCGARYSRFEKDDLVELRLTMQVLRSGRNHKDIPLYDDGHSNRTACSYGRVSRASKVKHPRLQTSTHLAVALLVPIAPLDCLPRRSLGTPKPYPQLKPALPAVSQTL